MGCPILMNLFIAVFQTFEGSEPYQELLNTVEFVTVVAFAVEYALRLWTAEYLYPEVERKRAVRKYVLSFSGIIELLAFLPYFLPVFFPAGAVAFRMFRVVRLLRLFQINAYYDALNVIGDVITGKKDQILISGHDRRARLRHHYHLPGGGDGGDTYGYLVCRIRGALYQDKDDERGIGGE